ncbi:hypothetical protein DL96DRAFT_708591 [Flagelloscypha sp. PMI_526]|nr:hypothetical protein DL96DRAFT_708591 [Flagelloscypha sp. PMI_526]
MPAPNVFQNKTIRVKTSQPDFLKMDSLEISPTILAVIQTSLNTSSTIPLHSTKALEHATESLRSEIGKMERRIESTLQFLRSLEDHKATLQTTCRTMTLALSHSLRPFPPLPLDLAQHIIHLACIDDRNTTLSVSLASKQMREWSDDCLWTSIMFRSNQRYTFRKFLDFSMTPNFLSSSRAERIQSLGFGCSLPPTSAVVFSLPNLKTFSVSSGQSLNWLQDVSSPSLRHLSCNPLDISRYLEFHLPIFQPLTHLNILAPSLSQQSRWLDSNWSDLRNLPCLTHLNLDASSVRDDAGLLALLEAALPDSLLLAVVCLHEPVHRSFHDVRTGLIDKRMVVSSAPSKSPSKPWVLLLSKVASSFDEWATVDFRGGGDLWVKGEMILKERNASLNADFK